MNRIKNIIGAALLLLGTLQVQAQNGLNVPFSQYGIGQTGMPYSTPFAGSLGGLCYTLTGNNFVNPYNPASYASIEKESFVFDMGLGIDLSTLRDAWTSLYDADGNISHITFAMPIAKWWKMAFGLQNYSDINYESVQLQRDPSYGEMKTRYDGVGGVSNLFWGHAFVIVPQRLTVGFNANLMLGTIDRGITYDFLGNDTTYFMNACRFKWTHVANMVFDLGLQYFQPLGERYQLGIGLTARLPRQMTVKDEALIYTLVNYGSEQYLRDTIFPLKGGESAFTSDLEQPLTLGVGLSLACKSRWMVGVDFTTAPWNGLKYTEDDSHAVFGSSALRYDSWNRVAVGFERSADKDASKYLRRISWRAGFNYEKGCLYLNLNEKEQWRLDQWGVGCGASLPMRKGKSLLNLSIRYSRYGDIDLLRRDCVSFGISVGSCENWFVKRKYN